MQTDVKKVFYYNTSANALGGFVEDPYQVIPSQGSVALPSVGGADLKETKQLFAFPHPTDPKLPEVVTCATSYSHVHGAHDKRNGPWTTRATSVVEKLNIANVLTADLAVARIYIEHPENGGPSRLSFGGSHFVNLRLNGKPLTIGMHRGLLPDAAAAVDDIYKQDAALKTDFYWSHVWSEAHAHSSKLHANSATPPWVKDRYKLVTDATQTTEGHTICSIVESIDGCPSGYSFGHIIDVPDVGRFFLGEVTVQRRSIQVTMVRAELGCKTTGNLSAASARGNGVGFP